MSPERVEELVRQNRFTISVVFPFIGGLLLLASAEQLLPEIIAFNPYLIIFGTLVMRTPLIAGIYRIIDRRAAYSLLALTAYSYIIEYIGTTTGFPYGQFQYGIELGPMILGKVPLGLPVFFIPLVINAYLLITLLYPSKTSRRIYRLPAVIATVLVLDLILDPGAVAINFWSYAEGVYYGVPVSNYLGWILSSTVAVVLLDAGFRRDRLVERLEECEFILDDMVSFIFLWGLINLYYFNTVPVLLAALLAIMLYRSERFNFVLKK